MGPLVSVIMPAYNGEKFIDKAINSIIKQTYSNWELIIVEDCSSDGTRKVLKKYQDNRIKIIYNTENEGIAKSTNKAIECSRGKYIALLDDDDVATNNRLKLQVDYLEENEDIDIVGGSSYYIDQNGNYIGFMEEPRINPSYIKAMLLFQNQSFANSTTMMRREFIKNNHLAYRDDCYGMQDYRFFIEASKVGKISAIKDFVLYYRFHEENETKKNKKYFAEERAHKYAEFQRYSLTESGYNLLDEEYNVIYKCFAEKNGMCDSEEEFFKLFKIFKKLLRQAKAMDIDYYKELEHLCKTKLSKMFINSDVFNWGQ